MREGQNKMLNGVGDLGYFGGIMRVEDFYFQVQKRKEESRKFQVLLSKEFRNVIVRILKVLDFQYEFLLLVLSFFLKNI